MTARLEPDPETGADIRSGSTAQELHCAGAWVLRGISQLEPRLASLSWPDRGEMTIDASAVSAMDTSGAWLLHRTVRALKQSGRSVQLRGLRPEFEALLQLIASREVAVQFEARPGLLARIGRQAWRSLTNAFGMLAFLGESIVALMRSVARPDRIRWRAIAYNLQVSGFEALPITGLLSFLMGIVIAYQGAEQLRQFGANIYVVDLVGLSMVRELSPMLTAIIVAGRSGSAYTAQIGTMKVTEEIDALRTIGVGPLELLVLPKMLALVVALPLLTLYTDVMGVLGGMIMARAQLDVSFGAFFDRLDEAISLTSFLIGIGKAPVFAVIIALVGCYQGFQVGGSADSVGRQTTLSVVQSVFLVIVTDAMFSIAFSWLDI
ncbi:MAG: MlaE family lipid ABC transporter permease subunit [Burkholderiales bacterium]|nr:MlaE family lipid ABC transporter permease subunit [Burkholderiales bacterium]